MFNAGSLRLQDPPSGCISCNSLESDLGLGRVVTLSKSAVLLRQSWRFLQLLVCLHHRCRLGICLSTFECQCLASMPERSVSSAHDLGRGPFSLPLHFLHESWSPTHPLSALPHFIATRHNVTVALCSGATGRPAASATARGHLGSRASNVGQPELTVLSSIATICEVTMPTPLLGLAT